MDVIGSNLDFSDRWRFVDSMLTESDKPVSAYKEVCAIEQYAKDCNDRVNYIRAICSKPTCVVSKDDIKSEIKKLQDVRLSLTDSVECCFVDLSLAEFYCRCKKMLRRRGYVSTDVVSDDIEKWSYENLRDKVMLLKSNVFSNSEVLKNTMAKDWAGFISDKDDTFFERKTLYDFFLLSFINLFSDDIRLFMNEEESVVSISCFDDCESFVADKTVSSNIIVEMYRSYLKYRLEQKDDVDMLVFADLSRLSFLYKNSTFSNCAKECKDDLYKKALERIIDVHSASSVVIEAIYLYSDFLLDNEINRNCRPEDFDKELPEKILKMCAVARKKFPDYHRVFLLDKIEKRIKPKDLSLSVNSVVYFKDSVPVKLHYANVENVKIKLFSGKLNSNKVDYDGWEFFQNISFSVDKSNYYIPSDKSVFLPPLPVGRYGMYVVETEEDEKRSLKEILDREYKFVVFDVVSFDCFSRFTNNKDGACDFVVVDYKSGKPIEGAKVSHFIEDGEFKRWAVTGNDGIATIFLAKDCYNDYKFVVEYNGKSRPLGFHFNPGYSYSIPNTSMRQSASVFTDRGVYRPGQEVFAKVIAYSYSDVRRELSSFAKFQVKVTSGKDVIYDKEFDTNEFGSFSFSFKLPEVCGNYAEISIIPKNGYSKDKVYYSINVEEYKRETVEVLPDDIVGDYVYGDTMPISGVVKTMNGVPCRNAKVDVKISSSFDYFRNRNESNYFGINESSISLYTVYTDNDGRFSVDFVPMPSVNTLDYVMADKKVVSNRYRVDFSATTVSGETVVNKDNTTFYVGNRSVSLEVDVENYIDNVNELAVKFSLFSVAGKCKEGKVKYSVYKLEKPKHFFKEIPFGKFLDKDFKEKRLVLEGVADLSVSDVVKFDINGILPGCYSVFAETEDKNGFVVKDRDCFSFFVAKEMKSLPVPMFSWIESERLEVCKGDSFRVRFGTSCDDVYALLTVRTGTKYLLRKWFNLNDEVVCHEFKYEEDYDGLIVVDYAFFKDGQLYIETCEIHGKGAKVKDEKLKLSLETFRDYVEVGGKEKWTIKVDGLSQEDRAEVLACMYDVSLDKVNKRNWSSYVFDKVMSLGGARYYNFSRWQERYDIRLKRSYYYRENGLPVDNGVRNFVCSNLYLPNRFNFYGRKNVIFDCYSEEVRAEAVCYYSTAESESKSKTKSPVISIKLEDSSDELGSVPEVDFSTVKLRENFAETAFFMPHVKTDSVGTAVIEFDVPDCLTRWKFRAFAHTAHFASGYMEKEFEAHKKFTITANLPRFFRQDDSGEIVAVVSNLSEEKLTGVAMLRLVNVADDKEILLVRKKFDADAGASVSLPFDFDINVGAGAVRVELKAVSGRNSDGEAKLLPVLSNRVVNVETMPFHIYGKGRKDFSFDNFINDSSVSRKNISLVAEVSETPSWYAIQSMLGCYEPCDRSAVSLAGALLVNSYVESILHKMPQVGAVVEKWMNAEDIENSFISKLSDNEELKNVLLAETPWVFNAENNVTNFKKLGDLFNKLRIESDNKKLVNKLKCLMRSDGSFSWFDGMDGSYFITENVLSLFAKLKEVCDVPEDVDLMIVRALKYIDKETLLFYKENDKVSLSSLIDYAYLRSFFMDIPLGENAEIFKFVKKELDSLTISNYGLIDKAKLCILCDNIGKKGVQKSIAESLREYARKSEEQGLFFDSNMSLPNHCLLMDAMSRSGASKVELDMMRLWLLRNKQTCDWNLPLNSVLGAYALVSGAEEWFKIGGVSVFLGGHTLGNKDKDLGTGYYKKSFSADSMYADMGKVSIEKSGSGLSYGALYWTYEESIGAIDESSAGLSVEKQIVKEVKKGDKVKYVVLKDGMSVKVGERLLMRLWIKADRRMDYVAVKDLRASCLEPESKRSGYVWGRNCYYLQVKDHSINFYIDRLEEGLTCIEYYVNVTHSGEYANGMATVQCQFSPEFKATSKGVGLKVEQR